VQEIPFTVARVVLQDFTGVPLLADLAAMRSAAARLGQPPGAIEPLVPVDLVVDHSVTVDHYGTRDALQKNMRLEFERNRERYAFMKWGMQAFDTFGVVPPGFGIVHQVNLEYLARGVHNKEGVFYPDTLVGTDSHTTMINGIGVVGWGVGGIEAEAGMLGQPVYFLTPDVVGVNLTGALREGVTATDLVLTITEMLRKEKVVGKFVEFFGEGTRTLALPDRATIANMAPEYGATMGFFPVDEKTVAYFRDTGRSESEIQAFEAYWKAQQMFGGHGYIEEWGMSQFVRDARIAMIYEGANGVQALDLVGRKLGKDGGRAVMAFFNEVGSFIKENEADETLKPLLKPLQVSLGHLQQATMWFMQNAMAKPDNAGAGSNDYMHCFGLVALGYMWAQIAKTAQEKLKAGANGSTERMNHKLVTARFFMERMLPETAAQLARIQSGAESMMALPAEAF
jgi:hypothetical protein